MITRRNCCSHSALNLRTDHGAPFFRFSAISLPKSASEPGERAARSSA